MNRYSDRPLISTLIDRHGSLVVYATSGDGRHVVDSAGPYRYLDDALDKAAEFDKVEGRTSEVYELVPISNPRGTDEVPGTSA